MALPTSGPMSANMISTELERVATATMSLNDAAVRSMAGKMTAGSAIDLDDFYGKTKDVPYYVGNMVVGQYNGNGYIYYGFSGGSIGSLSPTAIDGHTWQSIVIYGQGYSNTAPWVSVVGNATTKPWATGNGKITIGDMGPYPITSSTYDSKLTWTSLYIPLDPALLTYIMTKVGQSIPIRVAV